MAGTMMKGFVITGGILTLYGLTSLFNGISSDPAAIYHVAGTLGGFAAGGMLGFILGQKFSSSKAQVANLVPGLVLGLIIGLMASVGGYKAANDMHGMFVEKNIKNSSGRFALVR